LPVLLDRIDDDIASITADGAYDGQAVYYTVAERYPSAAVIVPPRAHGRCKLQVKRRTRSATNTSGALRLHARTLSNQRTEAKVAGNVLNRMTGLGMPVSVRIR
jgi:hypothetical protein